MRKRITYLICSLLAVNGVGACVMLEHKERYAQVCDDKAEPDCAPERKVIVR